MTDKMVNIGVLGADGSMGRFISRLCIDDPDVEISHAYSIAASPNLGTDIGVLVGRPEQCIKIKDVAKLEEDLTDNPPDVIIDFTVAMGTEINAPKIIKKGVPLIIGTTGMSKEFHASFNELCTITGTSAVVATNMATGVNIFFKIAQEITKYVKEWDIEVIEAHHHRKRDAPSGTALTTAEKIAEILGKDLNDIAKFGRDLGPNPRQLGDEEIGIHSIRAGDIVGEHTILYAGQGERIELIHRAHSRECFASGSITAAKFIVKRKDEGKIFDMQDVLGLK